MPRDDKLRGARGKQAKTRTTSAAFFGERVIAETYDTYIYATNHAAAISRRAIPSISGPVKTSIRGRYIPALSKTKHSSVVVFNAQTINTTKHKPLPVLSLSLPPSSGG